MQVTSTVKELQQATDNLVREQQKLIDQNLMLKEDSSKYQRNVTRYKEIAIELEALDEMKAKAMAALTSRPIGKDSQGNNMFIIGTPEPAKPLVAVTPKQSIQSTPKVGESLPTPEAPTFKALDALEIKRQQLELKKEELLKQLDKLNSELATVKEEMSAEITKVRESEAPKPQPETTKEEVPTKVVPKFPKLTDAKSRKELTQAVKFYRDNGKYFTSITLNKDTATIVSQLNKSLEGMNATERVTINQLVPVKATKVAKTTKTTEVDKKTTDNSISRKEMLAALKALATKPTEVKLNATNAQLVEWYNMYCK